MKTPHSVIRYKLSVTHYTSRILHSTFCFSAFLLFCFSAYGQNPNCYRITFSDKNNSPYSIERPEEFLSKRAIDKRKRFNIPITEQDLPVNPQYIDALLNLRTDTSQIIAVSKWNNSVVILYPETDNCHNIIAEIINNLSFVVDTLPVAYYKLPFRFQETLKENSEYFQKINSIQSYSCKYDYGKSIDNIKLHKGELLHRDGFCGEGMLICAFDCGWENCNSISFFQPLFENGQILGTRDLVPGINNIYIGNEDDPLYHTYFAHGTATLSQMAVCVEGKLVGTAPKASFFLIRTENPWGEQLVEEDFYAYGAEIADSLGADIVTASLSYSIFDYEWQNIYTPNHNNGVASIASRAASILVQKGVIVVNSAGNKGMLPWHFIGRPADAFDILAVGSVAKNGNVVFTSSYGPSADGRVKPDVAAMGAEAWVVLGNGTIGQWSGTSFAAPIIAGLSACLWQALPQYSAKELMQLIREYGDQANKPDDRKGYGIPDFYQCYLDNFIGVHENIIDDISVYPNPTSGGLRVQSSKFKLQDIEIYDIYGRKVSSHHLDISSSHYLINISHLSTGIYILKIMTEGNIYSHKIVKN